MRGLSAADAASPAPKPPGSALETTSSPVPQTAPVEPAGSKASRSAFTRSASVALGKRKAVPPERVAIGVPPAMAAMVSTACLAVMG